MSARIDGRSVEIRAGETILAAARRCGVAVPTLCYAEGLAPEGGCRICLVEAAGELHGACHTPLADGMTVLIEVNDALHRHADGALEAHHDGRVIDLDRAEIGKEREKRWRERLARQGAAGSG